MVVMDASIDSLSFDILCHILLVFHSLQRVVSSLNLLARVVVLTMVDKHEVFDGFEDSNGVGLNKVCHFRRVEILMRLVVGCIV